ncbi:tRNA lysidine(34) synthetase TilS [Polaromonas sp.]|uniref:tRNA lysidine(34) synthetase TilS n=1 Tax=Polaromonas sp. TaxID=1869339 RepID=UPI0025FA9646|nr:tRNA lysidine(34) synthetase TilS [Polaromonas sp.]
MHSPPPGAARLEKPINPALAGLATLFPADPPLPLGVAYSGGADSTALLLAAAERWPGQVEAFHVHHGLQAAADDFVQICESVCRQIGLPLHVILADARHAPGESPEDAARRTRYAALAASAAAHGMHGLLLGQHADDQVETLLLALSRGAGLPGLSAMPARFERGGMAFYRPLLQIPCAVLREWLAHQAIEFVDDPTNTDERYTRNRIRARLLPALAQAFPQFRTTFARSARHAAQAQAVLVEVAVQDLAAAGNPPAIKVLQALSTARQANLLRHWLLLQQATPSTAQLDQLLHQVAACTTRGHRIHLKVATGHVTRQGGSLHYAVTFTSTKG